MGIVYMSTPAYISLLFTERPGNLMLLGCGIWMAVGIFVMRKMINFKHLRAAMGADIIEPLFDPDVPGDAGGGDLAFATIVTLGIPLAERDGLGQRLKTWRERREELRQPITQPSTPSAATCASNRRLGQVHEGHRRALRSRQARGLRRQQEKPAMAGYRGPTPVIVFMFFRFVMPFIVFALALATSSSSPISNGRRSRRSASPSPRRWSAIYLPDLFVSNAISRRQASSCAPFPTRSTCC